MDILDESIGLTEKNKQLETTLERWVAYMFSSKFKPIIFSDTFGVEKGQIMDKLIQNLKILHKDCMFITQGAHNLSLEVDQGDFSMEMNRVQAKKFIFSASENTKKIEIEFGDLIKKLEASEQTVSHFKKKFDLIMKLIKENNLLLADIKGRKLIENKIVYEYEGMVRKVINYKALRTGDILLSFKSKTYFKKSVVSKVHSMLSGSQVTHILLAVKPSPTEAKIIDSYDVTGGVHLRDFDHYPGEVFIVLRPKLTSVQTAKILSGVRRLIEKKAGYSTIKLIGLVPSLLLSNMISKFTKGHVHIPNLFRKRDNEFFCLEFIDKVFKDAGILLTPKSKYSGMVFPGDIAVSPVLDYVGLIFEESERSKEIILEHLSEIKI